MTNVLLAVMPTISPNGYVGYFLIYLVWFIIIGVIILLLKQLVSKDFFTVKKWKIITATLLVIIPFILGISDISTAAENAHILVYIVLILSIIASFIVLYILLSAIERLIRIIPDKKAKNKGKEITGCILMILLLNPISLQILLLLVITGNTYIYVQSNTPCGIIIGNIIPESPASKAGIQQENIILKLDNINVNDVEGLVKYVSDKKAGESMNVTTSDSTYNLILDPKPGSDAGFIGIANLTTKYCKK